jgi:hypothetical protein
MFYADRVPDRELEPGSESGEWELPDTRELSPEELAQVRELMRSVEADASWEAPESSSRRSIQVRR